MKTALRYIHFLLCAIGCLTSIGLKAQYLEFVENKGQWPSQVKFKGGSGNVEFYLLSEGYKMVLHNSDDLHALAHPGKEKAVAGTIRSHAYQVSFLGGNKNARVFGEKLQPHYNNYFLGNDSRKWASGCRVYTAVVYQDVYPGIDVRYYTGQNNLKYDLIIHPGADASKIVMQFDGVDALKLKNQQLQIATSIMQVNEQKPYTYQSSQTGRQQVGSSFILNGNNLSFKLAAYDNTKTLVIDPEWIFSTFTGSVADNWGFTATYDKQGNFYAGGIAFGMGFPVSNGAYSTNYNGGIDDGWGAGYDIGIMKFNATGTQRIYATYIGGNSNEQPHSLICDSLGNLVIAGRTRSLNYPTTLTNIGPGGGYDIIVSRLNQAGTVLTASRKIGGSGFDCVNIAQGHTGSSQTIRRNYGDDARSEIIFDNDGNVCLAACTQSLDFPLQNPVQTINGGGATQQDAVVLRLSADLKTLIFSTYFGGSGDDAAFVISQNPTTKQLYVAGATTSNNLPGDSIGVIFPTYAGGQADGFIAIFDTLNQLSKVSYMGTIGADIIFGLKFDRRGFPYITGTTTGNWPVVNAGFSNANSKQFISKLQPNLSAFQYSTVFGKSSPNPDISPVAFLVDRCENVYVSGWGGNVNVIPGQSTTGMPITSDAIKGESQTDGSDFYFFVLARNATGVLYGSYFGQTGGTGEHVDGGTSRFDEEGVIYQAICANCGFGFKPQFPIHPPATAAFPVNPSNNCNLAAVKIAFNLAGVKSSLKASLQSSVKSLHCLPVQMEFRDTLAQGNKYIWSYGDGSKQDTTISPFSSHWFTTSGTYTIRLITIDSTKCNIADTAFGQVLVRNDSTTAKFTGNLESCATKKVNFSNNSTGPSFKPFSSKSFVWDYGDGKKDTTGLWPVSHVYAKAGTYKVVLHLVDTSYCNISRDSMIIVIKDSIQAKLHSDGQVNCLPSTVYLQDTSAQGASYIWAFGDSPATVTTDTPSIAHVYTAIGTYQVRLVAVDSSSCNITDTAYRTITIRNDKATIGAKVISLSCVTRKVGFDNLSLAPPGKPFTSRSFVWEFGDGKADTTGSQSVTHVYSLPGTYNVRLKIIDTQFCNKPDTSFSIVLLDSIHAAFQADTITCSPFTATLSSLTQGAQTYKWIFGDGSSATVKDTVHTYSTPGTYIVKLITAHSNTCNKVDTATQIIRIMPDPVAAFSISPNPPKVNTPVRFINQSVGANSFRWFLGEGDTIYTNRKDSVVQRLYLRTADYTSCLVAINNTGCKDTACNTFRALFVRLYDVANAFTPNGDGMNDILKIQGIGIRFVDWKIYNRWGKVVFETTDPNQGWNGKTNGKPQPMEVYTYTLNVEFMDGFRTGKTGDITLIR